mgnify:CR=1 FL=1
MRSRVHKAQGSEYPAVVNPASSRTKTALQPESDLYSSDKSKKMCHTVGSDSVFQEMIQNTSEQRRNTSLAERNPRTLHSDHRKI